MRAGSVLLGSAVLHGGVLALLSWWVPAAAEVRVPSATIDGRGLPRPAALPKGSAGSIEPPKLSVVDPHPDPIDIAIVDLHDEPASIAPTTRRIATFAHEPGARATGESQTTEPITASGSTSHSIGSEMFHHMRGPDLRPADGAMQRIAETDHPAPDRPYRSGRVDSAPNGTAIVHDKVTDIHVERDGTAHLHDTADISAEWRLPIHPDVVGDVRAFGRVVSEWYADPNAGTRFGRMQDLPQHLQAVEGGCGSWGDALCDDENAPGIEKHARDTGGGGGLPILGGKLDITSYLMRKLHVGDAYASRKLKLLDDTRDERVARGAEYRAYQLARSAELIRASVARLWAGTADPEARRAVLFELWDDCAEGDGTLGEAGQRARTQVIGWIRGHVPAGSPGAFTTDEIRALNARRASTQPFEPY